MARDSMETETLARLYLDQGHPQRAAPIFERLLAEDPGCLSATEGLARCRAAMQGPVAEDGMDREKRLNFLKRLLSRLTGEATDDEGELPRSLPLEATEPVAAPVAAALFEEQPIVGKEPASPPPIPKKPSDPRENKLQLLRAMLERLTEA